MTPTLTPTLTQAISSTRTAKRPPAPARQTHLSPHAKDLATLRDYLAAVRLYDATPRADWGTK